MLDNLIFDKNDGVLFFYDDKFGIKLFKSKYLIIDFLRELKNQLSIDPRFILGNGNPFARKCFYYLFTFLGGKLQNVMGRNSSFNNFYLNDHANIFNLWFIGAKTRLVLGSLINTSAQIHHGVVIGDFSEVNPGAVILGIAKIGNFTSVGSNATFLPKIEVGNNVLIWADSVVTENVSNNVMII